MYDLNISATERIEGSKMGYWRIWFRDGCELQIGDNGRQMKIYRYMGIERMEIGY